MERNDCLQSGGGVEAGGINLYTMEESDMKKIFSVALVSALVVGMTGGIAAAKPQDNMVQLGGAIYKDMNLSLNKNQSCQSCHHPSAGFADPDNRVDPVNLPVSDGSDTMLFGGRNAPTAAYSGFSPSFSYDSEAGLYIGGMFWDGRATGWTTLKDPIAEQALMPFTNPVEMGLASPRDVVEIVLASDYADLFLKIFGGPPDLNIESEVLEAYNNIGKAIAAFERSTNLVKFNSKFDKFWQEQGQNVAAFGIDENRKYEGLPTNFKSKVFTPQEAEGLALFNAEDKGKCSLCHLTSNHVEAGGIVYPPLFTDFTYDNLGIPVNPRIAKLAGEQPIDYGLGAKTAELKVANSALDFDDPTIYGSVPEGTLDGKVIDVVFSEIGKFKVPTLRNVARSAPYGHNGFFATLADITRFYNTRDVAAWPAPEVPSTVNDVELGNLNLSAEEEAAIVAFMKTLTD